MPLEEIPSKENHCSRTFENKEISEEKQLIFDIFLQTYFDPSKNLKTYFKAIFAQTPKKVNKISFSYQAKIILVT